MGHVYPLHPCALPGCDVLHKNAKYCCRDHERQAQALALETKMQRCKFCDKDRPAGDFIVTTSGGKKKRSKWCKACRAGVPAELRADLGNAEMQARQRMEKAQEARASPGVGLLWVEGLRLGHPSWPVGANSIQGAPFGA